MGIKITQKKMYNISNILRRNVLLIMLVGSICYGAGTFRVVGPKIFDPEGVQFIAKSVNINGWQTNWKDEHLTLGDLPKVKDVWRFNHLRLYLRVLRCVGCDKQSLYDIVDAYTAAKVVVMFTTHDKTGGLFSGSSLEVLKEFYTDLAKRYKDNPYVWFEPQNEPGGNNHEAIYNLNKTILTTIREAGAVNNIFVACGNNYSQEGTRWDPRPVTVEQSFILSKGEEMVKFNQENWGNNHVVFSPHFYRIWVHGDVKMADFIDKCYERNFPLICGEYGIRTPGGDCTPATKSIVRVGYPRQIGRSVWHWTGGDWNDLVTSGNGRARTIQVDASGNPSGLTWLGKVVWDDNHREEDLEMITDVEPRYAQQRKSRFSVRSGGSISDMPMLDRSRIAYPLTVENLAGQQCGAAGRTRSGKIAAGTYILQSHAEGVDRRPFRFSTLR
jgi:mannan endo-1,4-beta-mannosidase